MSQPIQRSLAMLGLVATLFVGAPSPAGAAGIGDLQIPDLVSGRAWQWLAKLWPGSSEQTSAHRPGTVRTKEGSVIDPNGITNPGDPAPALPSAGAFSEDGSAR